MKPLDKLAHWRYVDLDNWAYKQYNKNCVTKWRSRWRWRFWFEVTGQGHEARKYYKATGCHRVFTFRNGIEWIHMDSKSFRQARKEYYKNLQKESPK